MLENWCFSFHAEHTEVFSHFTFSNFFTFHPQIKKSSECEDKTCWLLIQVLSFRNVRVLKVTGPVLHRTSHFLGLFCFLILLPACLLCRDTFLYLFMDHTGTNPLCKGLDSNQVTGGRRPSRDFMWTDSSISHLQITHHD